MSLKISVRSLKVKATNHELFTSTRQLLPAELIIQAGEVFTLMGPSGCGKSSLLAAIAGTLPSALAFDGDVELNARSIVALPTAQRRVGLLFQDDLLFPHMTVGENLLFAIPAGSRRDRQEKLHAALAEVSLSDYENANPATLSGGQRARISLMRALLAEPEALLLDEPFSKFDTQLRERMRQTVFTTVQARKIPAVLVTHDNADVANENLLIRLD
jgi:putative thiamine transport system ATP-binding protein